MEDLSKQQLVLLALLVSFVTALATGIVTVSLMDQAPEGITRTVSQVIERTVQQVIPQPAAVSQATSSPFYSTSDAVAKVMKSIVTIEGHQPGMVSGIGLIMAANGMLVTDKSILSTGSDYVARYPDGRSVPVTIVRSQNNGDIVFLAPLLARMPATTTLSYAPLENAASFSLGESVFALSWVDGPILSQGVIARQASTLPSQPVLTTIPLSKVDPASPVFNIKGQVVGMKVASGGGEDGAQFYPIGDIRAAISDLR